MIDAQPSPRPNEIISQQRREQLRKVPEAVVTKVKEWTQEGKMWLSQLKQKALREPDKSLQAIAESPILEDRVVSNLTHDTAAKPDSTLELKKEGDTILVGDVQEMESINPSLGTNTGGVYKDRGTGKEFYIKRYSDRLKSTCEFISNRIYTLSGAPVLRGQLVKDGQSIAYATEYQNDFSKLPADRRAEAKSFFVTSAFLLDWDAVGTGPENPYGNLQTDSHGSMFLVDHGGSILMRGLLGRKSPDSLVANAVPEIDTMRSDINPRSKAIFGDLTNAEIAEQARNFLHAVSEKQIEAIIAQSQVEDPVERGKILDLLLGRRRALEQRYGQDAQTGKKDDAGSANIVSVRDRMKLLTEKYGVQPNEQFKYDPLTGEYIGNKPDRLAEVQLEHMEGEARKLKLAVRMSEVSEKFENIVGKTSGDLWPRVAIRSDSTHIENQRLDFILDKGRGKVLINFKLTPTAYEHVVARHQTPSKGEPTYFTYGKGPNKTEITEAWTLENNGVNVYISKGEIIGSRVNSAKGLVQIEVPMGPGEYKKGLDMYSNVIDRVFKTELGVDGWADVPDTEAEQQYYKTIYAQHYKVDESVDADEISKLKKTEILPGFETVVCPDKHLEYKEKYGEYALYHDIQTSALLSKILSAGNLYSSHERYRRGLMVKGMSVRTDFAMGGADGVFTRAYTEQGLDATENIIPFLVQTTTDRRRRRCGVLIEPSELDRIDWYAYERDRCGGKDPDDFKERQSPDELFMQQKERGIDFRNEQIFPLGARIKAIVTGAENRQEVLDQLRQAGITEYNGRKIDDVVVAVEDYYDLIDVSWNRSPRSYQRDDELPLAA